MRKRLAEKLKQGVHWPLRPKCFYFREQAIIMRVFSKLFFGKFRRVKLKGYDRMIVPLVKESWQCPVEFK